MRSLPTQLKHYIYSFCSLYDYDCCCYALAEKPDFELYAKYNPDKREWPTIETAMHQFNFKLPLMRYVFHNRGETMSNDLSRAMWHAAAEGYLDLVKFVYYEAKFTEIPEELVKEVKYNKHKEVLRFFKGKTITPEYRSPYERTCGFRCFISIFQCLYCIFPDSCLEGCGKIVLKCLCCY